MNISKSKGNVGETFVAKHLVRNGYSVVKRNFHSRYGEIDIIAVNHEFIVFVEVKARKSKPIVSALESVDKIKQVKITKTAMLYLQDYPSDLQPRFDVAEVIMRYDRAESINYIEDAFEIQTDLFLY